MKFTRKTYDRAIRRAQCRFAFAMRYTNRRYEMHIRTFMLREALTHNDMIGKLTARRRVNGKGL